MSETEDGTPQRSSNLFSVLAVDPGSEKCGMALVARDGTLLRRAILSPEDVAQTVASWVEESDVVLLGRGTGYKPVAQSLSALGVAFVLADERGPTLQARRLYWQATPRRGWRRLVPVGLLLPPEPIDDWAAVVLAWRYLGLA